MSRHTVAAAAVALLMAAAGAQAQNVEPATPKELKDAERFIASAMTTPDSAQRRSRLERALNPIQQAIAKYPDNAKVWLEAGQVYASLHDFVRADSAFDKAEKLYAPYAEEINRNRLQAWSDAFGLGVTAMDANDYESAIKQMQFAEVMYADRPESKLNLAALYANKGDVVNAEAAFRSTITAAEGPLKEKLQPQDQAAWKRYSETARISISNLVAQRGIDAFNAEKYDDAIAAFREALTMNPNSRDHAYNLAQSMYAKARNMEQTYDSLNTAKKFADADKIGTELVTLYNDIEPVVAETRAKDPNNEDVFILMMRSYRIRGSLTKDAAKKAAYDKRVNELLAQHEAMQFEISQLAIPTSGSDVTIKGVLTNLKLAPGTPVKLHFTLLGFDGTSVGEAEVTVNAPAVKAEAPFTVATKATKDIAGWKYDVVK